MARLTPYSDFPKWDDDLGCRENYARQNEAMDRLMARSARLPDGQVIGAILEFPIGDGAAFYQVVLAKPLTLRHLPYGDGHHQLMPNMIRRLRLSDVLVQIRHQRLMDRLFSPQG